MKRTFLATVATVLLATPALASPYKAEYVFGDSLSDRGNLAELGVLQTAFGVPVTTNFPDAPSNHDSFTNGPVAVQLLAKSLGLNADPSVFVTGYKDTNGLFGGTAYTPGTNYAVAGATSADLAPGKGGIPGANLGGQVGAFGIATGGKADPGALYVVMIGGNDVRNATLNGTGNTAVAAGVNAELMAIKTLTAEGARNLLVVNVPDVGVIPEFAQDLPGRAADTTAESKLYDSQLAAGLAALTLPTGTDLIQFDLFAYNAQILADAGILGFTNTSDRCYLYTPISAITSPACGPNAENIDSFTYWDSVHPTGRVQALWALGFAQALNGLAPIVPTPAPAAGALLGIALLGLAQRRR